MLMLRSVKLDMKVLRSAAGQGLNTLDSLSFAVEGELAHKTTQNRKPNDSSAYILPVLSIADEIEIPASRQDGLQTCLCDVEHLGWPVVTSLPDANHCLWENLRDGREVGRGGGEEEDGGRGEQEDGGRREEEDEGEGGGIAKGKGKGERERRRGERFIE